jgi:hypothetical protein
VHELNVLNVLLGDLCDWNIKDVDVLTANQVKQQVERPFECLQEYL